MTKFIIGWLLLAEAVYLHRMRLGWLIEPSGPWEGGNAVLLEMAGRVDFPSMD